MSDLIRPMAPTRLMIFWDYDTQWGADRSRSSGGPKAWGSLEFENTNRLLELHESHQWPACFAVVGSAALPGDRPYHDPGQIRRIAEAGHEVASHSHRHEWLPGLGLGALRETVRSSKDALEQCTGKPVVSFVPPFNQPFDYPPGWSFSLAERREVPRDRTGLQRLLEVLGETGYRFCRVAYRPWPQRLVESVLRRRWEWPGRVGIQSGVRFVRINTPGGFSDARRVLEQHCRGRGGIVVAYGHPHSLKLGNSQDEKWLVPFLQTASELRRAGRLSPCLPRMVLDEKAGS